ncbi:MAG: hypothetical protein JJU40_07400 [Rhodobacteraceae bacterium]|nr:hypothetical protein [Paracoccaceae bacterium]
MLEHLPRDVLEGLDRARRERMRRKSRLRVRVGEEVFPILRFRDDGFSVDAAGTPNLRGLVDILEGGRHLYQALIVYSERDGGEMRYEFKRHTPSHTTPPADYHRDEAAPVALLPRE